MQPQEFKITKFFSNETKNINGAYHKDDEYQNKHSILIWQLNVNVEQDENGVWYGGFEQYTLNTGDCERYTCYFCHKYDIDYVTGRLNFVSNKLSSFDGNLDFLPKRIIKILQQNGFNVQGEKKLQSLYRINY